MVSMEIPVMRNRATQPPNIHLIGADTLLHTVVPDVRRLSSNLLTFMLLLYY